MAELRDCTRIDDTASDTTLHHEVTFFLGPNLRHSSPPVGHAKGVQVHDQRGVVSVRQSRCISRPTPLASTPLQKAYATTQTAVMIFSANVRAFATSETIAAAVLIRLIIEPIWV